MLKLKSLRMAPIAILLSLLTFSQTSFSKENLEVRKITPPKLEGAHLGKKILCHRPMRRGSPRLDIMRVASKIVANNYGHGGSGWTLGPGSSKYVIDQLEKEMPKDSKETPIAVIGAGALGLFSTIELIDRGYTNVTVIAENFENLTSHNAGGLLAPVSMDNDPKMQKIVDEIGIEAYKYFYEIANGTHRIIKAGARMMPTYFPNREDSGLEPYVGKVIKPAKDVILDFENGVQRRMVAYDDGIFMDTGKLMDEMKSYLEKVAKEGKERGIKLSFVKRKVQGFNDIEQNIIINCTGLGSRELNRDGQMVPVQGHLIMLKDQNPKDLDHMILVYFGKAKTLSGFDVKRSFYMFPKQLPGSTAKDIGVIGGTFIEGADVKSPNEEEFDLMMKGAREFYFGEAK